LDILPDAGWLDQTALPCAACSEVAGEPAAGPRCGDPPGIEFLPAAGGNCDAEDGWPRGRITLAHALPAATAALPPAPRACAAPPDGGDPGKGRQLFVSPEGDDAGDGSEAQPWRTIAQGVDRLQPGDTLFLRGGVYRERGIEIGARGTLEASIGIMSFADEEVVIDGSFPEFQAPGNDEWTLVAAETGLWRSKRRYEAGKFFGKIEVGGKLHALNVYRELAAIGSRRTTWSRSGDYYLGPGLHWSREDGHIYVRLQPPDVESIHGRAFPIPAIDDPRHNRLFIGNHLSGLRLEGARHLVLKGIGIRHFLRPIDLRAGGIISLLDLAIVPGRTGILVQKGVRDLTLRGLTIDAGFPAWVAWRDVKSKPRVAARLKLTGVLVRSETACISITHSRFIDVFDGITAAGSPEHLSIRHNAFDRVIDDALQLGTAAAHVEFGYNLVFGPGPSHHGSGPSPAPGTKYIHHNVIDVRHDELYSRVGEDRAGWRHHIPLPTHSIKAAGPDPWKIYHNTILFRRNTNNAGAGQERKGPREGPPHEVYNNIFVQHSDYRASRGARVDDGAEIFDGNLYHRTVPRAEASLFSSWRRGEETRSFASLAEFRSSSFAAATRAYYLPGWEQMGIEADPLLRDPPGRDYRPALDGPAALGALDLGATGWPGAHAGGYRGAVDPRAASGLGAVGPIAPSRPAHAAADVTRAGDGAP
jgi:hypothetical protein